MLGQSVLIFVDSGVTGNFMNLEFIQKLGILRKQKVKPEPITRLNGENLKILILIVKSETIPMAVMDHFEYMNFDVTPLE